MFSPASLEAQKLISVSIGKINASRVTRTGTSLHRSLLVASVLHKARNVYLDEERERALSSPPPHPYSPTQQQLTVTPLPAPAPVSNENNLNSENDILRCHEDNVTTPDCCEENRLPHDGAFISLPSGEKTDSHSSESTNTTNTTTTVTAITNTSTVTTTTTSSSSHARKRRRVSDQETAAAISSILPKRLRSELRDDASRQADNFTSEVTCSPVLPEVPDCSERLALSSETKSENFTTASKVTDRLSVPAEGTEERVPSPDGESSSSASPQSSDDSDSDSDDAVSDTSTTSSTCDDEMEVDQLTSLVSYFSFSQSQQKTDFCLSPIHSSPSVVALTA